MTIVDRKAQEVPWERHMGDDGSLTFTIKLNGSAVNLTGATVLGQIRASRSATSTLLATLTTSGSTLASGVINAVIPTSYRNSETAVRPWYEISVDHSALGGKRTVITGPMPNQVDVAT